MWTYIWPIQLWQCICFEIERWLRYEWVSDQRILVFMQEPYWMVNVVSQTAGVGFSGVVRCNCCNPALFRPSLVLHFIWYGNIKAIFFIFYVAIVAIVATVAIIATLYCSAQAWFCTTYDKATFRKSFANGTWITLNYAVFVAYLLTLQLLQLHLLPPVLKSAL